MYKNQVKGKSSEILFELMCLNQGFHCCKPIVEFVHYDYIVDFGNGFKKIQVKSVYWDKNRKEYRCDLRKSKRNSKVKQKYSDGDFDILAINTATNTWVLIPWETVRNNTEIKLSDRRITDGTANTITFQI